MPIEEKAINGVFAELLSKQGLEATPEVTQKGRGGKRLDIQARISPNADRFTAIEAKLGQTSGNKNAAINDAMRWLTHPRVRQAIALCYPSYVADPPNGDVRRALATCDELRMVEVSADGAVSAWDSGGTGQLVRMIRTPSASQKHERIVEVLKEAIIAASDCLSNKTLTDLAERLKLPPPPNGRRRRVQDPRPARIAALIFVNVALLQDRLKATSRHRTLKKLPGLAEMLNLRHDGKSLRKGMLDSWREIRSIDFAPVVDPAIAALETCPVDGATERMLGYLVDGASEVAHHFEDLQLDHAGPLYHDLLESAKYDGSFYTSTAASVLLAELALPSTLLGDAQDWKDLERVGELRICDPACGTGTLLMAAGRTIVNRHANSKGTQQRLAGLHKVLVEDVLHGLDINTHGLHLAACMLTVASPSVDYIRMNLHRMKYGLSGVKGDTARAGSIDMLVEHKDFLPGLAPNLAQTALKAGGEVEEQLDLKGKVDLVIMNPPFTRNDIRSRQLNKKERKKVQERENEIASSVKDPEYWRAIDQTSIQTFFTPLADMLAKPKGSLAMVVPSTFCSGSAALGQRRLLHDRFHIEAVITSHDNRRIYFSENTNINETLIVARRRGSETTMRGRQGMTAFVSLSENPSAATGAQVLARAIRRALEGDETALLDHGTIAWRGREQMRPESWRAAWFYDQGLENEFEKLLVSDGLGPLGELAEVDPDGRGVRAAFSVRQAQQAPNYKALWNHKTDKRKTMAAEADSHIGAKKGREEYARSLWERRSHLLLANRLRLNLARTTAVYMSSPCLGSAWVPIRPIDTKNSEDIQKAWCVWLNSSAGILAMLSHRQKTLTYPSFSMAGIRQLPVPDPDRCDMRSLARTYGALRDRELMPLPAMRDDPVRKMLDDAVSEDVSLHDFEFDDLRARISDEPSVTGL